MIRIYSNYLRLRNGQKEWAKRDKESIRHEIKIKFGVNN